MYRETGDGGMESLDELMGRCKDDVKSWGMLLRAPPGAGKSTLGNRVSDFLEEAGETVIRCAPTHCAVRQMRQPACTLHRLAYTCFSKGRVPRLRGYLVVDEIFACSMLLHCLLNALVTSTDVRVIAIGDENQFAAVSSSWRGVHVCPETVLGSAYMHRLCGGASVELSQCRRSDKELFEIYMKPPPIEDLRKILPYIGLAETNICVSHAYRKHIIHEITQARLMRITERGSRPASRSGGGCTRETSATRSPSASS